MPFVWCLGLVHQSLSLIDATNDPASSILGPALGGALALPCDSYPKLFVRGSIFDRFPFLLPNLVCAIILAFGVLVGLLFLEETHEEKRHRRDIGLEVGDWITRKCRRQRPMSFSDKVDGALFEETVTLLLLEEDEPPGYRSTEGTPRRQRSRSQSPVSTRLSINLMKKEGLISPPRAIMKAFTRGVVLNIIGFGILA